MNKKAVSEILLTLLLVGTLTLAFNIQPAKADWTWTETIYIRADGGVVPDTAPISSVDNITYILTDNIVGDVPEDSSAIVVERDNIVVDGAGYTLQGTEVLLFSKGIDLTYRKNVTIKNMEIASFWYGIYLSMSSNNSIYRNNLLGSYWILLQSSFYNTVSGNNNSYIWLRQSSYNTILANDVWEIELNKYSTYNTVIGNTITNSTWGIDINGNSNNNLVSENNIRNNKWGIHIFKASYNTIYGNNITNNNGTGVFLWNSPYNSLYHNNFVDNTEQAFIADLYNNTWDEGCPSGGNYWSDYAGVDEKSGPNQDQPGSDGLGDTPYDILENNQDNYPLMGPISFFNAGTWGETTYQVDTVSNSTVSDFHFSESEKLISFNVAGSDGTVGFSRITISNVLLGGPYIVLVSDSPPMTISEWSNGTHTFLYFTYYHSVKSVEIGGTTVVPEFSTWISILLLLIVISVALVIQRRKQLKALIQ